MDHSRALWSAGAHDRPLGLRPDLKSSSAEFSNRTGGAGVVNEDPARALPQMPILFAVIDQGVARSFQESAKRPAPVWELRWSKLIVVQPPHQNGKLGTEVAGEFHRQLTTNRQDSIQDEPNPLMIGPDALGYLA